MKRSSFSPLMLWLFLACAPRTVEIPAAARACARVPVSSNTFAEQYFSGYSLSLFTKSGRHDLEVQLEIQADGEGALVGFSPIGNREFSVSALRSGAHVEMGPLFKSEIAPELLFLLFRLTLSPLESIKSELSTCGITLTDQGKLSNTRIFRGFGSSELFLHSDGNGDILVLDLSGKYTLVGKRNSH